MGKPTKRFSYLLLDEGEFYIQDWMAICRSGSVGLSAERQSWQQHRLKGRLRLCSKSIFFEPDNISLPIVMYPLNKVKKIDGGGSEPPMSPSPVNSKWSRRQEGFVLETTLFVNMKGGGIDAPYVFEKQESKWWFSLEFASVQQFLLQAQSFLSINRLPASERDMVLSNSMAQKEAQGRFDTSRLNDLNEEIFLDCPAAQVTPLVREPGRLVLTQTHLYFQPLHNLNNDSPVRSQPLSTVVTVARRRHALRHIGLEIFSTELDLVSRSTLGSGLSDGGSAFFTFRTVEERDGALAELLKQIGGLTNKAASIGPLLEADSPWLEGVMQAWQEGNISNYDYLIYLNLAAGRSFCDLTQWPVMPWVLKDYKSHVLDLNDPETFRDLSKPIGALNAERLSIYKERYGQMAEEGGPDRPFLYGTHYSTPGYVLYWLVRSAPAHMLRLQNGRFDAPDRLFVSIMDSWDSVINNPADLKELIPEFFVRPGDFLLMREGLNLGVRQGGDAVGDVKLPPWCKSSNDFIYKHREALECEHVSKNLHLWIDLIFGSKQRGEAALAADNVFHYLTYEGSVDLETIVDPVQRASLEAQINEFGQAPQQLFSRPHPARLVGCTKSRKVLKDFDGILHKEVFRGLNPQFLVRIMATSSIQDLRTGYALKFPQVKSPVSPFVGGESLGDGPNRSGQNVLFEGDNHDAELSFSRLSSTRDIEDQRFMRLSSARTSEEERFLRLTSARSDHSMCDSWSPASCSGTEYKENDCKTSGEAFHLQEDVEQSMLLARRLATGSISTMLENVSTQTDTFNDLGQRKTRRDQTSPHPLMFKERLSMSQSLRLHRGPVKAVVLSEENASESLTLYSAGQDGFVKVFSVRENCQVRATKLGILPLSALALAGSCDEYPIVLAGSNDNCLYAYSVDYGRPIGKMRVHEDTVTCVKLVDHSLQRLITASSDATIKIWTMEEGRGGWTTGFSLNPTDSEPACVPEGQFLEHEGAILSLDVQEGGYLAVSGEEDGSVIAWDMRNPSTGMWQQRGILQGPAVGIRLITNGPELVVASGEGNVHLLDVRKSGSCIATYDCKMALKCIEATNETVLAGSANGGLYICLANLDSAGNTEEDASLLGGASLQDHTEAVNSISISSIRSRSASNLATASDDGCIHLYTL